MRYTKKDAKLHHWSENYKCKLHCEIATHPPKQPILSRPTISSLSDNVEGLELSYTTKNADKYSQFGKLFGNHYLNY